jgi:hypothetical protein
MPTQRKPLSDSGELPERGRHVLDTLLLFVISYGCLGYRVYKPWRESTRAKAGRHAVKRSKFTSH